MSRKFKVLENAWIPMSDGVKLAARMWIPENAEEDKVPAVFEYLPYGKRYGTFKRDESTYPVFAAAGIAGVRVDIRGNGESEGVMDGEYTPQELKDACEAIDWISKQPWCNGNVGMMGISWGGFNSLQVAAARPPALKAIISMASTVDRYNDDIHYKNGCHLSANLYWSNVMLCYQARPPDPVLVGDRWKEMWLERLQKSQAFLEDWLQHQRRDDFWKHGSIREDFSSIQIPTLILAGWADGYRNAPLWAVEGLGDKCKAILGPWVHSYPHFAYPKPRWEFHKEAIRWWNRWLKGESNGAEEIPQVQAYILDSPKPEVNRLEDPGEWITKKTWSKPMFEEWHIAPGRKLASWVSGFANPVIEPQDFYLKSPLDVGTSSGEYFPLKPDAEMPGDQTYDDLLSMYFESYPLRGDDIDETSSPKPKAYLGRPIFHANVSCDAPTANLIVRLSDVHPDGKSTRITYGVLNLAHRNGNEHPQPMPKGEQVPIKIELDACGYKTKRGHKLRLAISTSYWPFVLPSMGDPGVTIDLSSIRLEMPLLGEHEEGDMPIPENPDPLPKWTQLKMAVIQRYLNHDFFTDTSSFHVYEDYGIDEVPTPKNQNTLLEASRDEVWTIKRCDPLSNVGKATFKVALKRHDEHGKLIHTTTVAESELRCTRDEWIHAAKLMAYEGEKLIFEKSFEKNISRDFM